MAPQSQSRPLNPLERRIHQACVTHEKKMLAQKDVDALVPDVNLRVAAINFLLNTGMLKMMQDENKQISYKAVMKKEMEVYVRAYDAFFEIYKATPLILRKREMGGDENMVLDYIQNSGNEGIWTKHLKAKTELHQTVINRSLKSLEQKGLVKVVKSVKNPTRKIYMMSHLEPSVEVTGGPWYSENELDTEFIKMLSTACLRFIQDKSYPKLSASAASAAPLYPVSHASSYPTSKQIHGWLQKTKLSEQELGVEHVEMLLDVLVFDGEVEKLPAYGAGMWDMGATDADSEGERREMKRKRKAEGEERKKTMNIKGKKRSRKDESSDEASDGGDEARKTRKKRKTEVKEESDAIEEDMIEKKQKKRKKRKRGDDTDSDAEGSEDDSDASRRKYKKHKRPSLTKPRSKSGSKLRRNSSSESSSSESESEASDSSPGSRKKKKKKSKKKSTSARSSESKHTSKGTFAMDSETEGSDGMVVLGDLGSATVYRAVRQERVSLGWSQAPCGRCPVFDFCHENGPINPKSCTYYSDWVQQGVADF